MVTPHLLRHLRTKGCAAEERGHHRHRSQASASGTAAAAAFVMASSISVIAADIAITRPIPNAALTTAAAPLTITAAITYPAATAITSLIRAAADADFIIINDSIHATTAVTVTAASFATTKLATSVTLHPAAARGTFDTFSVSTKATAVSIATITYIVIIATSIAS